MKKPLRIVKYRDVRGKTRARIVSGNGKILFETSENYERRRGVDSAVVVLTQEIASRNFVIIDEIDK